MLDYLFGQDYWLARLLFQRGLAAIYVIAFLVAVNQFLPLLGEHGLLPVPRFLRFVSSHESPSIFHWYYSDTVFLIVAWSGVILSLAALFGLSEKLPWWGSACLWALLWMFYLSIVNVGQTFYAFGWESMLLEAGFLAIFAGASKNAMPFVLILLLRWMLFRVEFGAGLIKLRGDECWRDLTCLNYHHETQPMPNPLSWYFHNLPPGMHKLEVLGNHFFQLVVPWGLFFPQPIAAVAAGLIIVSQLWLVLSGNFSWLNWLVIVLATSGFSDAWLGKLVPVKIPHVLSASGFYKGAVLATAALIVYLSYWPARNLISKHQLMNASFNPFHLVNTYGAFGSVTKTRYEIVIEGTDESILTSQTVWREYEFDGKPGDPSRRPGQFAPYHLRLDWLMWFASFGPREQEHWFAPLVEKLLKGDKATLGLVAHNPFLDQPPRFIRARYYRYHFTTPKERTETRAWWKRELVGEYLPPVSLK